MTITTLTPPSGEPLSLADAKAFARVGGNHDDTLISQLISAARARVEQATGLALMPRSLRLTLSEWPLGVLDRGGLALPHRPAHELIAVRITDGVTEDDVTSSLELDPSLAAGLRLAPGKGWPWPRSVHERIEIDWQAGFPALEDIPDDLIHALKLIVAHEFENRDASDYRAQDRLQDRLREVLMPWMERRI